MENLVILKVGTALDSLRARRGDFEHYFAAALGVSFDQCRVVDPRLDEAFPSRDQCCGVVITGSAQMITENPKWSRNSERWLREVVDHGTPVLGICYGHQLLAKVLGGRVGNTANGKEIGTTMVDFDADGYSQLFGREVPKRLTVQACHSQSVLELPSDARLLASNAHDPVQGFAWRDHAWGFQFHPEFDADIVRTYIDADAIDLRQAGHDPQHILANTRDSNHGRALLRSFANFAGLVGIAESIP